MTYLTRDVSNAPGRQAWASDGPPAELNIMAQSTSIQRVQRLIDSVPLTNLLFTLLSTSYKKVRTPSSLLALVCPMSKSLKPMQSVLMFRFLEQVRFYP